VSARVSAEFLEHDGRRILLVVRQPIAGAERCALLVPPFAEEMNKCRSIYADLAEALAERGVATVLPDLFGTGDSEGEFRDATWERWLADLRRTLVWAAAAGWTVTGAVATRLGCALAAEALATTGTSLATTVFWQPVADGARYLTQFLRLRVAASMMGAGKETVDGLRERLRSGESLEVAGYDLPPSLAAAVDSADLAASLTDRLGAVRWLEVRSDAAAPFGAATEQAVAAAKRRYANVELEQVGGEPFWSSTEIVRNAALVARTADLLSSA